MKWYLKSKTLDPTLIRLAQKINQENSSNIVSPNDSIFYVVKLPFYSDFKLYRFIDLSFTPYLEVRLIDNGTNSFILDGTQNPFLEVNAISPPIISSENVYEYAMLVLGNTKKNDYSFRLINSIDEISFSTEPTKEQYLQVESSIRTPKIKKEKKSFLIKTTLLFGEAIIEASISVLLDGKVEIIKEKKILDNMPVMELVLD